MSKILAIDPGTNTAGMAYFDRDRLIYTQSVSCSDAKENRYGRTLSILGTIFDLTEAKTNIDPNVTKTGTLVCENPIMRGHAQIAIQRFIGGLETLFQRQAVEISPTSVKAAMGFGGASKEDVRKALLELLDEEELQVASKVILDRDYDACDAIAIGLTYLGRRLKRNEKTKKSKKKQKGRQKRAR